MKPFSAVLSNPAHPEYGVATIPFPIPDEQYSQVMERLEALEIGDAVRQDCRVNEGGRKGFSSQCLETGNVGGKDQNYALLRFCQISRI